MAILNDGFSTTITFASASSVLFKEKEVTPPGVAAGGEVDITTMRNTTWRTKNAKALRTLSPMSLVVAYDPDLYITILSIIGDNQLITVTFPDGATLAFYGWLDEFKPNRLSEGEQPTAEITIIPSNHNAGTETAPVVA